MKGSVPQPSTPQRIRIGELLVEQGIITEEQLEQALREQQVTGRKLGQTLAALGYVREDDLLEFLSRQLGLPRVDLRHCHCEPDVVRRLPETHARRLRAVVLEVLDGAFRVAMADPTDVFAVDELGRLLGGRIYPEIAREPDLLDTFDRVYRRTEEISSFAVELDEELSADEIGLGGLGTEDTADAPVAKLLQSIFEDALQVRASDVHIEPDEGQLRIRQRVDGVLQEQIVPGGRLGSAVVLRLKLVAGLDISERRMPQDGRFVLRIKGRRVDVRVSTMPTEHGEGVVLRLLDRAGQLASLEQLGMPAALVARVRALISRPHGLLVVTGPTGSGKTTTLYTALRELDTPERKIITVEDPVEYRLPRVTQVQVNPRIGLDFGRVLRSALRHDPDVLLIGEMRDRETVSMGLRAALTGHLVLSTLHTNDAAAAAARLLDMGAEGYLVASSLQAVIAQRLVRRVCERCRRPDELDDGLRAWLAAVTTNEEASHRFLRGSGCTHCHGTGYAGRVGVYEILVVDARQRDALRRGDVGAFEAAARRAPGYRPLGELALDLARTGVTPLSEVVRLVEQGELGAGGDA